MELVLNRNDLSRSEVTMLHNGEEMLWNISPFERTELSGEVDVFRPINQFWARLDIDSQNCIFAIYKNIKQTLDDGVDLDSLTLQLQKLIRELLDNYHSLDSIEYWVQYYSDLAIPSTIPVSINFEDGSPATEEKTYLQKDYRKLVALSIALRTIVPIWGEFIFRTRSECGTTFKEFYAKRLLNYSVICESEAMKKLMKYVEHQLPPDRSSAGAILGGISSDDYPEFMLARVLVRRLCIGDITGINPQSTILTFIYKYIRQKNSSQKSNQKPGGSSNFNENVREKFPESSGDSDEGENKLSKLEGYKIQEQMSRGNVVTIRYYLDDPYRAAAVIEPDLDLNLLDISLKSVMALANQMIEQPQLTIMQWILKPAISPKGLASVNKAGLLKAAAIVQAILWHRGHKQLAALVTSYSVPSNEHRIFTVESRARVTKELQETLRTFFPFSRKSGGKSKSAKVINPALSAIDNVADQLCAKQWIITVPDDWIKEIDPSMTNRKYSAPFDIKIKLAQLICQFVNRRKSNV